MNKEFILCAAVLINDKKYHEDQPAKNIKTGFVVSGRRHSDCYQTITSLKGDLNEYMDSLDLSNADYRRSQGFLTSTNRFVSRQEAWKIALANDQIQFGKEATDPDDPKLISEHLY